MAQKECGNGHIYDPDIYSECPYCESGDATLDFGNSATDYEALKSAAETFILPEELKKTVATDDYLKQQNELGKTVAVFTAQTGMDPVVGWIVCINGKSKGKDYRLLAKTNSIGRSEAMDVSISGDMTISSDTHAKIDYDILNNNFYLLTGNNTNTIYMNNVPVYSAQKLSAYDVLRFGKSEFLFVPFCGDKFQWPDKDGDK